MSEPDKAEEDIVPIARGKTEHENSELVFHYKAREQGQRRASASELAQKANARPGLMKSLAGGKGNFFVLISIVLICIMTVLGYRISSGQTNKGLSLGRNTVNLSILDEDNILFLSIQKHAPARKAAYTGPVDIAASPALPIGEGNLSFVTQRVFFSDSSTEIFRFSLPFGGDEVIVILRTENETVTQTVKRQINK